MIRFVLILLASILLITVVRSIVGVLMKAFAELVNPSSSPVATKRPEVPVSGELKRDPVCSTFVSAATPFRKVVDGQTFYFCSENCRSRYRTV